MHLGPDEYDPNELRRIARDVPRTRRNGDSRSDDDRFDDDRFDSRGPFRFDSLFSDQSRQGASEVLWLSQFEHLLAHQSCGEGDDVKKPYLHSLPDKCGTEHVVFG